MALLRNNALATHPQLTRMPQTPEAWDKFVKVLNAQNVDALTILEYIRVGDPAPSYDSGTGIWIGLDAGTAKLFVGTSSGNKITWNGTTLSITGSVNLTNSTQTFTPTGWGGFSTDPSGDISYMDLGNIIFMWRDTALTGLSDELFMNFSGGVPSAIRPSAERDAPCYVINDNSSYTGTCVVGTGGAMNFYINTTDGLGADQKVTYDDAFATGGAVKGLPAGWLITYPK